MKNNQSFKQRISKSYETYRCRDNNGAAADDEDEETSAFADKHEEESKSAEKAKRLQDS